MLRFAEAGTDSAVVGCFCSVRPTRLSPDKGLAVFNRSAHSAGPGRGKREEGGGKKEEGRRRREEGRGKKEEGNGNSEEGTGKKTIFENL